MAHIHEKRLPEMIAASGVLYYFTNKYISSMSHEITNFLQQETGLAAASHIYVNHTI